MKQVEDDAFCILDCLLQFAHTFSSRHSPSLIFETICVNFRFFEMRAFGFFRNK